MIERFENWLWGTFFGPLNKRRFKMRIALRVRCLALMVWWQHIRWRKLFGGLPRPLLLFLVAIGLPFALLFYWAELFPALAPGEFPNLSIKKLNDVKLPDTIDLRAVGQIAQPALVLIGIPAAFILWMFRDANAQASLENQRKDVNLKEFQEIQLRATGAIDEKFPEDARESLQIAATHQLAGFLRGEYGASFQRPAWELLRAQLLGSAKAMGYQSIPKQVTEWRDADPETRVSAKELGNNIRIGLRKITKSSIGEAQRGGLRDEWRTVFRGKLPLTDTVFDGLDLPRNSLLAGRHLERCSLIGARMWDLHLEGAFLSEAHLEGTITWKAHLEGANLERAHLEGATLWRAHLEGANLERAHLEGAILWRAHLEGADLRFAHLEGATLWRAHLEGAFLGDAHLEGANLSHAHLDDKTELTNAAFDDATIFAEDWDELAAEQKIAARAPWIARGMKHVDQLAEERKEREEREKLEVATQPPA